jgi:pimeloyl-ACP methyl ester carboxylesterase
MSTYVLIHGSWHAAWCWYKIVPRLEQAGHRAIAIDLPGHGRDRTPASEVTLSGYVAAITDVLDAADETVVLVAHSRGGIAITQAAEARPEKIQNLVYLAAFLVPNGETIVPFAFADSDSLIMPNLDINQDAGWDMLRSEAFRPALYHDCSNDDVALAQTLLAPEPIGPTNTPMQTTAERFGRVPRVYIELLQDRAVSPMLQRKMYTALPCQDVLSLDASHSAYFSKPDELAARILQAGGVRC